MTDVLSARCTAGCAGMVCSVRTGNAKTSCPSQASFWQHQAGELRWLQLGPSAAQDGRPVAQGTPVTELAAPFPRPQQL